MQPKAAPGGWMGSHLNPPFTSAHEFSLLRSSSSLSPAPPTPTPIPDFGMSTPGVSEGQVTENETSCFALFGLGISKVCFCISVFMELGSANVTGM